jgi:hypothetical protein
MIALRCTRDLLREYIDLRAMLFPPDWEEEAKIPSGTAEYEVAFERMIALQNTLQTRSCSAP